ncbi:MAG TPA: DUF58 domain-containing protein [Methylomirabilota bacterium]|jgi:uncharacterized protein (DUF58 family)|nr:DUF58 domain-containing protein [Methylomirabilota bacterium]
MVTPLTVSLLVVAGWAFSLGVLAARPELYLAALPLLLALATLARRVPLPGESITHEISRDRLFEGETARVTITVTARTPVALIEVLGPRPPGSRVVSGSHKAVRTLRAGQTAQWSYDLRFPGRGAHDLGTVAVRTRDRFGVRAWERRHVGAKLVRVYPRIAPLRSLPQPVHARTSVGDYVSPAVGEGIEPGDIREFAPGDRIRQVNWRASLRLGTLYVTQHQRERNADVVLMLDTLAEVGAPPETTLDLGVRAAASLASAYLARKDRVGLVVYGGVMSWVTPASGRVQGERLADALVRASVVFTYVAKDLALVPPRVLPPQAFVIAITPLLDRRFTKAILDLAARGFDPVVLVVSPVEVTRATLGSSPIVDLACRLWTLERRNELGALRRQGLEVLEWCPPAPLEVALAGSRRQRRRLALMG